MNENLQKSAPVAVVTGASRGIGRAIAIKLRQRGYEVVGVYVNRDDAAQTVSDEHGIDMVKADAGCYEDVQRLISYTIENYKRLDAVVNNAGIEKIGPLETYDPADWKRMMATHVDSVFYTSKLAIPHLKNSDNGVIVNVSSRMGLQQYLEAGDIAYGTAKAAVNAFTVALAREVAPQGIRVNAVLPYSTDTDLLYDFLSEEQIRAKRYAGDIGTPEEAADLVLQLVEDREAQEKILADPRVKL